MMNKNLKLEFTLKDFDEFCTRFRKDAIERNKKLAAEQEKSDLEEKKRRDTILSQKYIHIKCDQQNGLYPMTKEKLLAQIELINNATMKIDSYGNMTSHKAWCYMLIKGDCIEMDSEKMYEYYLTDVKPWIF